MKDNRKTIQVLVILTIIFTVMGGSLAYWNWNTTEAQRTNVTFTVEKSFSCAADGGGDVTSSNVYVVPTTCTDSEYVEEVKKANGGSLPADYVPRVIKREIKVKPTIKKADLSIYMDLWLDIDDLGEGLSDSQNFKYVLTTSSNSCSEGTIIAEGTFNGKSKGDTITLLNRKVYSATLTETYWLYIWLDNNEEGNLSSEMNQAFSFSLNGRCTDNPETNVFSERIIYLSGNGEVLEKTEELVAASIPVSSEVITVDSLGSFSQSSNGTWYGASDETSDEPLILIVNEESKYKICGQNGSWPGDGESSVHINNEIFTSEFNSDSDSCYSLGTLSVGDEIKVYAPSWTEDYGDAGGFTFTMKIQTNMSVSGLSYRYQGENPNNYVTFNGETWRIIGSIDGGLIGLESGKYYTKIIRNVSDSIYYDEDLIDSGMIVYATEFYYYYDEQIGDYVDGEFSGYVFGLSNVDYYSGARNWFPPIGYVNLYGSDVHASGETVVASKSEDCYMEITCELGSREDVKYYPSVYLDSSVVITDGDGSSGSPFKISKG